MKKLLNLIPNKFYQELSAGKFDNIYIELSGGYHSSYTALNFFKKGYKCFLIFNETYLEYQETKENIQKIIKITDYPINVIKPNLKPYKNIHDLMKASFEGIEKAKKTKDYRDYFPCCKKLKKQPAKNWISKNLLDNSVVISSLTPYESFQRQMRLLELKKQNTYFRNHKTKGCIVGYPFRDLLYSNRKYTRKIIEPIFEAYLLKFNLNIKHSGCKICPIRIINPIMLEKNDCSIKYNKIYNKR